MASSAQASSSKAATSSTTNEKSPDATAKETKQAASFAVPPLELTALSPTVYIYRPPVKPAAKKDDAKPPSFLTPLKPRSAATTPRVILLMGWMNAPLRLVTKYAAPYALLFPQATIVVQLSTGVTFIKNREEHDAGFRHIVDVLKESKASMRARSALHDQLRQLEDNSTQAGLRLDADAQKTLAQSDEDVSNEAEQQKSNDDAIGGGVLIHSFSDGGSFNVAQLLKRVESEDVPPPLAHIMDSSPGRASAYSGSTAITMSLVKRPWIRVIARMAVYIYLFVLYRFKTLTGRPSWSNVMRRALNTPRKWDWQTKGAKDGERGLESATLPPRCYLYSRSDALIEFRAVEEHAREAAKLHGLLAPKQVLSLPDVKDPADKATGQAQRQLVALRRWEGVQHCDIGRVDFDGYWTAVRRFLSAIL